MRIMHVSVALLGWMDTRACEVATSRSVGCDVEGLFGDAIGIPFVKSAGGNQAAVIFSQLSRKRGAVSAVSIRALTWKF